MEKEQNIPEIKRGIFPEIDLDTKKELAKIGMTASMGITVATSMYMKTKFMKRLHVVAGVALVGFSYWHHTLYQPAKKKDKKEQIQKPEESVEKVEELETESKE